MRTRIQSEMHWHALRAGHIGASEVACLYDCGFMSPFHLYHLKAGSLPPEDFANNESIVLGRHLESAIATAASELHGLSLTKCNDYYTDDSIEGFGSTPDYFMGDEVVEVKNCSWGAYRDNWIYNDDGTVEPPLRYQLQVQAQLACTGAPRGHLIALIAGDRIVKCEIEPHADIQRDMRARITAFWTAVHNKIEPDPDYSRDLAAMKGAWQAGTGAVDLSGEPDIEQPLDQIAQLRAQRARYDAELETLEAQVLAYCVKRGYSAVRANAGRISVRNREARPERQVLYKAQPQKIEMRITPAK